MVQYFCERTKLWAGLGIPKDGAKDNFENFSITQNMLACLSSQDSKEVEVFQKTFQFSVVSKF